MGSLAETSASCSLSYWVPSSSSSTLQREAMQTCQSGEWLALRLYSAIGERSTLLEG
jgi:hypothetical protein